MTQFGHPNVLYILNKVSGEDLFSQLETIAPVTAEFAVALTDSQVRFCIFSGQSVIMNDRNSQIC